MKWFEYQMEVDELKAPDALKARLLAMDPKPERPASPPEPGPRSKKKGCAVAFPRWQRWAVGVAACAAVVFLGSQVVQLGSLSTMNLFAAGGAASSTAMASVPSAAQYSIAEDNSLEAGSTRSMTEGSSAVAGDKIIYTAYLSLETKDYDTARADLEQALTDAGGWMESSSESNNSDNTRTLSLTLRIPEENYESFLTAAGETASLVSRSEQAEDVTSSYTDVAGRIANLEGQRDRLRELQASAETLSDLLDIEAQLSDVQYQLESWQSQLDWYDDQIASCTVTVNLREVETYTPTGESFLERLGVAFAQGWQNFVLGLAAILVTLAGLWPVVVIVVAVAAAVIVIRARRRRR